MLDSEPAFFFFFPFFFFFFKFSGGNDWVQELSTARRDYCYIQSKRWVQPEYKKDKAPGDDHSSEVIIRNQVIAY